MAEGDTGRGDLERGEFDCAGALRRLGAPEVSHIVRCASEHDQDDKDERGDRSEVCGE